MKTLAVLTGFGSTLVASRYTANVIFYNLLTDGRTMKFSGCKTGANGTIMVTPGSIAAGQVSRLEVDTHEFMEDITGFCSWQLEDPGGCDVVPPPPGATCPWFR